MKPQSAARSGCGVRSAPAVRPRGRAARRPTILAQAKAWRLGTLVAAGAANAAIVLWVDGPLPIPGRVVKDIITPMAPALFAFALTACSRALTASTLELRHRARPRRRGLFLTVLFGTAAAASLLPAALGSAASPLVLLRNCGMYVGAVLVVGEAWFAEATLVLVLYCVAAWILGAQGVGVPPRAWAVSLQPPDHLGAGALAAALTLAGAGRFLLARPRAPGP